MTTRPLIPLDARKTLVALILIAGANPVARAQEPAPELTSKSVILKDLAATALALYPTFGKLPGDDKVSLLVGTRHNAKGRLRVFRNIGTRTNPQYGDGYWLDEKGPSARIPGG